MKLAAEERRHQILEEATKLFSVEGYDKVTTKRLAAACGVTEPALYRYFTSKEVIYDAVLDSLESRLECDDMYGDLDSEDEVGQLLSRIATQPFGSDSVATRLAGVAPDSAGFGPRAAAPAP